LLPPTHKKPFHTSKEYETALNVLQQMLGEKLDLVHICTYAAPFGVVPLEIDDVYPISQSMIASPYDQETIGYVARQVEYYITETAYENVVLLREPKVWKGKILAACRRACKKKQVPFVALQEREPWANSTTEHLVSVVNESVADA
jgi:predicted RNA-binding protein